MNFKIHNPRPDPEILFLSFATLEVLEPIKAKAGFIKGGGKNAFQIVLDRANLNKVRRVQGSTRILK